MGSKRMFSLRVVDTDKFMDMPCSTQALYFHLGMHGDDDGFVSSPRKLQRAAGCSDDDLRLLAAKGYIIPFESGVIVITDWKVNNTLKNDRYQETIYQSEKELLQVEESGKYALLDPKRFQVGSEMDPQLNLTKHNLTKPNLTNTTYSCTEPKNASTPPVITLPLNTGEEYPIFSEKLPELSALYPAVDVMQALREMRGWLIGNPKQRKTKSGIMRFVTNWLSREQNKGGKRNTPTTPRGNAASSEPSILDSLPL